MLLKSGAKHAKSKKLEGFDQLSDQVQQLNATVNLLEWDDQKTDLQLRFHLQSLKRARQL